MYLYMLSTPSVISDSFSIIKIHKWSPYIKNLTKKYTFKKVKREIPSLTRIYRYHSPLKLCNNSKGQTASWNKRYMYLDIYDIVHIGIGPTENIHICTVGDIDIIYVNDRVQIGTIKPPTKSIVRKVLSTFTKIIENEWSM